MITKVKHCSHQNNICQQAQTLNSSQNVMDVSLCKVQLLPILKVSWYCSRYGNTFFWM